MYIAALIITIIGWLFQGYETLIKKSRNISVLLPATYGVSCLLYGINSFGSGEVLYGVIDIVLVVFTALVLVYLVSKK